MAIKFRSALCGGISVAAVLLAMSSQAAHAETRSCVDPTNPTLAGTGTQTAAPDIVTPGALIPGPPIFVPGPLIQIPDGFGGFILVPGPGTFLPGPLIQGPPTITSANSTVCGPGASALGTSSVAVGHNAFVANGATNGVAIGANARATVATQSPWAADRLPMLRLLCRSGRLGSSDALSMWRRGQAPPMPSMSHS